MIDIAIEDRRWRLIPQLQARLEKAFEVTIRHLPKAMQFPCMATLLLTSDAEIRQLNRDFRGITRATNVLSFPQFTRGQLTKKGKKTSPLNIGDMAIAYQYVVAEARKEHKILINHVTHLLIHGLLHLFGYDHDLNAEALLMERLEQKIMKSLGLPDPYADVMPKKAARKPRIRA